MRVYGINLDLLQQTYLNSLYPKASSPVSPGVWVIINSKFYKLYYCKVCSFFFELYTAESKLSVRLSEPVSWKLEVLESFEKILPSRLLFVLWYTCYMKEWPSR